MGLLGIGDGRVAAAVIEDGSEDLVVALIEAEESNLQIVLLVVGGEVGLASDVGGAAVFGGGDGIVGWDCWRSLRCCSGKTAKPWSGDAN